jgi:hypothetical protein
MLVVGRATEHDRVAVGEIAGEPAKFSDFSRANEGEVLRIEENDLPFSGKALFGDLFEGGFPVS